MIPEHQSALPAPASFAPRVLPRPSEQQLLQEITQLKTQLAVLHGVNDRLGQHLSDALQRLGESPADVAATLEHAESLMLRHDQAQLLEYLNPLLASYQAKIRGQEQVIAELRGVVGECRRKSQLLADDSRLFREQLQKKNEYIIGLCSGGHPDSGMAQLYSKLNEEDQALKAALAAQESQYLQSHVASLQAQLSSLRQLYDQARSSSETHSRRARQLADDLKNQQIACQDSEKIKHILEKKLREITDQNLKYEGTVTQLQSKAQRMENESKLNRAQSMSLKASLAELEEKYGQRTGQLEREVQDLKRAQKSLFLKNGELQRQATEAGRDLADAKQELSTLRGEQQNMLTMLENYETKITGLKRALDLAQGALQGAKEREQQAVLQSDRLQLQVSERDQKMQLMADNFRQEIEQLKQSYEQIIKTKRKKEHDIDEECGMDGQERERQREKRQKVRERKRVQRQKERQRLRAEEKRKEEQITGQKDTLLNVYRQRQEFNESLLKQKLEALQQRCSQQEQQLRRLQASKKELELELEYKRNGALQQETELKSIRSRLTALLKQNEGLAGQVSQARREGQSRISMVQTQYSSVIQGLEKRLADCLRKQKVLREQTIRKLRSYDSEEEQVRRQYEDRIRQLQTENAHLKRK